MNSDVCYEGRCMSGIVGILRSDTDVKHQTTSLSRQPIYVSAATSKSCEISVVGATAGIKIVST